MRTTITIDDHLHEVVMALARHNRKSFGEMVGILVRRGMVLDSTDFSAEPARSVPEIDADTGFPLIRSERIITEEDVRSLEDEP